MLERIVAQFAFALLSWVEKRIDRSRVAIDADEDTATLGRAGNRVAEWLRREQDRIRTGSKSDAAGTGREATGLPPDQR